MNEEMLKALYEQLQLKDKDVSFDQFKADMDNNTPMHEAVMDKLSLREKGVTLQQFQTDLGMLQEEEPQPAGGTPVQEGEALSLDTEGLQNARERAVENDEDESGVFGTLVESLGRGSAMVGSMIAKTPAMLYDVFAWPQNMVAKMIGKPEMQVSSKSFAENLNLPENEIANYYDALAEESRKNFDNKFDKSLTEYWSDGDYGKFGEKLANMVVESAPVTLGLMMSNVAGAGTVGTTIGGGVVFGAGEIDEQLEAGLDPATATSNAMSKGLMEGFFESFGVTRLGGVIKDIAKRRGVDAAKEFAEKTFKESYAPLLTKYLGVGAEEMIGEAATQFGQNVVDKYGGAKPDIDLMEGVYEAGIVGLGASAFYSSGPAMVDIAITKENRERAKKLEERKKVIDEVLQDNPPTEIVEETIAERSAVIEEELDVYREEKEEFESLSDESKNKVISLREELNNVNKAIDENQEKPAVLERLTKKKNELENKINNIIGDNNLEEDVPQTETTNKPTQRKLTEDDLEVVFGKGNEGQLILPKDVKITEEMSQELKTELAKISAEVDEGASVMSDKQKKDYSNKVKAKTLEIYNKYAENNKQAETTLDQVTVEPSKNNAGIEVKVDGKAEPKIETKEEVIKTLSNERFGLLTAENPNATKLSEEENAQKNEEARAWLIDKGYEPVEAIGRYNNYENSFMVPGLTREDAVEFANKFDQESVATNEGLVYQDGSFNPRVKGNDNFEITASPEQDFYSTINTAEGPVSFSIGYNFDTRENVSEIPTDQSNLVEKKTKIRELDNTINAPELYGKVIQSLSDEEDNGVIPKSAIGKLRNAFVEDLDNGIGLAQALTRHEARVKNHKRKSIQGELKPKHFPPGMGDQLINQLIEHQKQKRQLLDESADLKTKIDRNKKVSNLIENLFGKPGERSQRSGKSVIPLPRLIDIVANAKKAMSKVLPGVKIKVYKTPESFAKATGVTNPNVGGEYNPKTKTISINASAARETTLAHEIFHAAILSKMGTDAEAQALTKKLIDDIIKDVPPRLRVYLDQFASNYDENIRNEEKLAELGGILAQAYLNGKPTLKSKIMDWVNNLAKRFGLKPFVKNEVYDALRSMSRDIATGVEISNRDFGIISGSDTIIKEDVQALAEGASTYIAEPATINSPRNHYTNVEPIDNSELSFVTSSDLFDIESLISEIADKGEKVWFWVADQLGRGNYFDTLINDEHYLDAGPSYALDPVNRDRKVVWATGKAKRSIDRLIGSSDYIFIISGSPTKSKLFNKRVISLLEKRVGDYKKFKNGLLSSKPTKPIANIINKYDNWNDLKESPDRKELLNAINNTKKLKTRTPLKGFLEDNNAFINLNDLRDGFYKANDFKLNDIMLVLKPKQFGGKSNHSTYNYDILGDVIGVPNKKINAFDIMPNDIRSRYEETLNNIQKSQVVAPYGSGIRNIDSSNISNRYQMSAENPNIGEDAIPNMTEDGNGNFVFYHYSDLKLNKIDPEKFGLNSKTSRAERADLVGAPHAFFYTVPNFAEQGVGDIQHQVKIPKDKVYDATKDPRGFYDEAKKQFKNLRGEQMAFNPNAQIAWISKVASENGYEMSIARWGLDPNDGNYLRAQSPMIKTPEAKNGEYKSNLQKGITVESQITKADENLNDVYQEISDYRDEQGNYDDLYSLREQAFYGFEDKYSPFPDQESITNAIMSSDIPQSLKNKYQKAIKSEGVTINKKPGTRYSINPSETTKVENIITQFPDIEVNELTDMLKPYIPKINSYDVKKIKDQVENGISQNAPGWQGNPPKNGPQPFRGRVANIPQQPGMDEDGNMLLKTKDINDIREYFDLEEYNTNTKTYEALIEESRQFMSTDAEMFARETKVVYDILNGGETSNLDAKMIAIRVAIDKLQNILNVQKGLLESATNKSDELMYQRNVDSLEADIHDFTTAYNRIGTVGGRILRFRQNQLKSDFYSPNRLRRLMRDANNGENLTKEQEVEVEKASGSLKELQKKVDQLYSEDILRNESLLQEFAKKAINQKIKDSKKTFRRKPKNLLTVNDAKSNLDNILKNGPC